MLLAVNNWSSLTDTFSIASVQNADMLNFMKTQVQLPVI